MRLVSCIYILAVFAVTTGQVSSLKITTSQALEEYLCEDEPITDHTVLELSNITHRIRPGKFCLITDLVNVSIVGPAVIQCTTGPQNASNLTGFGFRNITDLSIRKTRFQNCGGILTNESYTFRDSQLINPGRFLQAVVVLNSCFNVNFSEIEIVDYLGYAILSLNVLGNSTFEGLTIHRSHANNLGLKKIDEPNNFLLSGSGMIVYFIDRGFEDRAQYNSSTRAIQHFLTIRKAIITKNTNLFPVILGPVVRNMIAHAENELPLPLGGAGGLSIVSIQLLYNIQVDIVDSEITENLGNLSAGLLILYQNTINHAVVNVHNCLLRNNTPLSQERKGGGIQIRFNFVFSKLAFLTQRSSTLLGNQSVEIRDTVVRDHTAKYGAGISVVSTPQNITTIQVSIRNVSFLGNVARENGDCIFARGERSAFFQATNLHLLLDRVRVDSMRLRGSSGAFTFIDLGRVHISGSESSPSIFENGTNSVITAFSTDTYISGTVIFQNNNALIGGALYLRDGSLLFLTKGVNITFQNNTAEERGGAIFIDPFNGLHCALQIVTNNAEFKQSKIISSPENLSALEFSVHFIDNDANLGRSMQGGRFYNCTGFPDSLVQLPTNECIFDSLFSFQPGISYKDEIRGIPMSLCFCTRGESFKCIDNDEMEIQATPGKPFTVGVAPVDGVRQPVGGFITASVEKGELQSVNNSLIDRRSGRCQELEYIIMGVENTMTQLTLAMQSDNLIIKVHLHILPCPKGFSLSNTIKMCNCVPLYRDQGITCNATTNLISVSGVQWVGLVDTNETREEALVSTCPYGYCNSDLAVNISKPADICLGGRTGVLCGACKEGLSRKFGTTNCGQCSNLYLLTIVVYAFAGVLLVSLLFLLKLTVSSGTLNGLVFYSQLMGSTLTVVKNTPTQIISFPISLLYLDLGFPICFYNGMNEMTKVGLQFVFPVYIWLLVIFIIMATNYSTRLQKIFANNICVNVLVTLIYLSVGKIIRTVTLSLIPARVLTESEAYYVWFFDGSEKFVDSCSYFVLVAVSVLFAFLSLTYIFSLLLSQWCGLRVGRLTPYLKPVIDAHSAPFKDKFRFWIGFRLLFLLIFIVPTAFLTARFFPLLMYVHFVMIFGLTLSQALLAPFKTKVLNLLDLFFLANICLYIGTQLFLLTPTMLKTNAATIVDSVFLGSATVVGIGIFGYHLFFMRGLWKVMKRLAKRLKEKSKQLTIFSYCYREAKTVNHELTNVTSATNPIVRRKLVTRSELQIRLRESLLEDN